MYLAPMAERSAGVHGPVLDAQLTSNIDVEILRIFNLIMGSSSFYHCIE